MRRPTPRAQVVHDPLGRDPGSNRQAARRPADPDVVFLLNREAELHELAAERYFLLGDAPHGERERELASKYRIAAQRFEDPQADLDPEITELARRALRTASPPLGDDRQGDRR